MDREEKRSTMRCLYCGEPLSLLRKLTGKAEFCSEAHREAYQQEFNSLALQRLAAQPKHNRRPESVPPPAPIEAAPVAPAEVPFAGLPFPEDADELELPVFDSPIFAATQTQVDAPVDEAVAPASLWVLLSCPSLPALGALAPSYSFSVGLAGYPRDCMMTAGPVAPHAGHAFPDAGYVDLPAAMGEESLAIALVDAEPLVAYFQSCALPPGDPISLTPRQIWQPDALFVFDAALSDAGHRTELPPSTCPPTPLAASLRLAYPWLVAVNPEAQLASPPLAVIQELPEPFLPAFETQPSSDASMPLQPPVAPVDLSGVTSRVTAPDRAPDLHPHCSAAEVWPGCSTEAPPEECEIPTLIESFDVDRSLIVSEFQPASLLPSLATASLVTFDGAIPAAPFERQPDAPPQPQSTFTRFDRLCTVPSFASAPSLILPRAGSFPTPPPRAESAFSDDSPAALYVPFAAPPAQLALTFAAAAGSPGWVALPDGAPASSPDIHPRSGDQLPVKPVTTTWEAFPCSGSLAQPALANHCLDRRWPSETGLASHVLALHTPAHGDTPDNAPKPVASPDWLHAPLPLSSRAFSARVRPASSLSQVRITDFAWPQFAAGCDSLFTPDQPFRFHEMSFPHRGTTDMAVGEALGGSMMSGLRLTFSDDRFNSILQPGLSPSDVEEWLSQSASEPSSWASAPSPTRVAIPPPPVAASAAIDPSARKVTEPPSSWQQAAKAMHEGEQQVPREMQSPAPAPPVPAPPAAPPPATKPPVVHPPAANQKAERKPVIAVPVTAPILGTELACLKPVEPPTPFVRHDPLDSRDKNQSPYSDGPQFEWRREQPYQAPPPPPPAGSSSVSVNTTIIVEGGAGAGGGVVVENAVRISLGDRGGKNGKSKSDALERFTDGDDLAANRIQMAPPEGLPEFVADAAELRAVLQTFASLAESIQWPKFSITPMRRRVAFGPAKGGLFGSGSGPLASKVPVEAKPVLPPKKSVGGFLFKKLTNS